MSLREEVERAFAPDGALVAGNTRLLSREGQQQMAVAVAETIEDGGVLVAEAGTGIGKTFSYLVPVLLSGERALFSTATKTLQDQLFARDLPRISEALGLPVRAALLKGRASYLCQHRLGLARADVGSSGDRPTAHALARVEQWAQSTRSGDLAELPGLDERSPMIPLITSTRENCLGQKCPQWRECHVNAARREALAADVVVINHHLFFADLAVRESGMAELLPTVRIAVFDEAHQLNETGVQFLGARLGTGQLIDLARDVLASGQQLARGLADWSGLAARLDHAARDLRLCVGAAAPGARLRWGDGSPDGIDSAAWSEALDDVALACEQANDALCTVSELAPDLDRLAERASTLGERARRFASPAAAGVVRWLDVGAQLRLVESPLDIAETVRTRMLGLPAVNAQAEAHSGFDAVAADSSSASVSDRPRAWIFTSATLGDDAALRWFTEPCGLTDARVLRVASPFNYGAQAAVYVPANLPKPSDPAHPRALATQLMPHIARLRGRTLILTTTLRALREIGDALAQGFMADGAVEVLVQGQWPKRYLMERFREADSQGRPGCVLVASASFWEGFDVPGDALQLVVIDKLPFPPPGDPLVEARSQRIERTGKSAFNRYFLPEAAVALKQGAGRLIRNESDRGILVIGDTRLLTMGYGRRLLAALPPMRRIDTAEEFGQEIDTLVTTASTTDRSCL